MSHLYSMAFLRSSTFVLWHVENALVCYFGQMATASPSMYTPISHASRIAVRFRYVDFIILHHVLALPDGYHPILCFHTLGPKWLFDLLKIRFWKSMSNRAGILYSGVFRYEKLIWVGLSWIFWNISKIKQVFWHFFSMYTHFNFSDLFLASSLTFFCSFCIKFWKN